MSTLGKAPVQRVHPGLHGNTRRMELTCNVCPNRSPLPQSCRCFPSWIPGSAVSTLQTAPLPSAINHAFPKHLLGKTVTSLEKKHFRSQTSQPSKATLASYHSLQLLLHCHRERQVTTSAPSTTVSPGEKDYEKDRESFGRELTWEDRDLR